MATLNKFLLALAITLVTAISIAVGRHYNFSAYEYLALGATSLVVDALICSALLDESTKESIRRAFDK